MKKGSYGRSKLIGHSPIKRKWNFTATIGGFTDIASIAIFYVNSDNTNISTVYSIGSPIFSILRNQLKLVSLDTYGYDITKIIQTYGSGCYFFAWVNTSGQVEDNQLLLSYNGGIANPDCLIFTPAIETLWRNGPQFNPINAIRGAYIKNPALPLNLDYIGEENHLRLQYGDTQK